MINLILSGFYGKTLHKVTRNIFNDFDINYANIIYHKETIKRLRAKKIEWVDYYQIDKIKQHPIDQNNLIPLDEKLIVEMANCERIVLKMMDRLGWFGQYSYQDRVKKYYFYLRYWNHIILEHKINLFISANVPHEVFDFIIYELCKKRKIPVLFLYHQSQITDTALIMTDWKKNSLELKKRYDYLKKHITKENPIELSERFDEQFKAQMTSSSEAVPFYMKNENLSKKIKKKLSKYILIIKIIWKDVTGNSPDLLGKVIDHILRFRLLALAVKKQVIDSYLDLYYRRKSVYPDFSKSYIYLPLQYQPELSTSPLADAYVDQLLIVRMISKYLPKRVLIYVKEHPKQTSFCRSIGFYQDLLKTRGVVLINKNAESLNLIKNAKAIATSTGTPGWEALFRQKPVMMFGSYIYQFADGVFKITTNDDCVKAIHEIFINNKKPLLRNTKIFLKALSDVSIQAVIDPDYLTVSHLKEEENIRNITNALEKEINKAIRK